MGFDIAEYRKKIAEAVSFLKPKIEAQQPIGIILGTGLGGLVNEIDIKKEIEYNKIPHFPHSTVESHEGKLLFGTLAEKQVLAMQGRFHFYEGYSMKEITFPVRVMYELGIRTLLISNAAGGMNIHFKKGDLMIIDDHINLLGTNPLIGPNLDEYGPRFPDMSEPYSRRLLDLAENVALDHKIKLQRGVYVAVPGPQLETRAEYRFLKIIGADAVGMSTIPENIVAVHMGMEVMGISVITDECFPDALQPVNLPDIIAAANSAEPKLTLIMKEVVRKL